MVELTRAPAPWQPAQARGVPLNTPADVTGLAAGELVRAGQGEARRKVLRDRPRRRRVGLRHRPVRRQRRRQDADHGHDARQRDRGNADPGGATRNIPNAVVHGRAPVVAPLARFGRDGQRSAAQPLDFAEIARRVAAFAGRPVLAVMDVVAAVAGDAFAPDRRNLFARQPVAGAAGKWPVRTIQREPRPAVVVVVPDPPVARVVALRAIGAQRQLVLVVLRVAGGALRLGVLVRGRQVALAALDARVAPDELEARLVVVEANRLLPVRGLVALLALPAELLAMLVVLPVARVAVGP